MVAIPRSCARRCSGGWLAQAPVSTASCSWTSAKHHGVAVLAILVVVLAPVIPATSHTEAAACRETASASFPSLDILREDLFNKSQRGSVSHQQYVVAVFDAMEEAMTKCKSKSLTGNLANNVSYEGIDMAVFMDGAQSRFANEEQQFGFNNARTLVNLLAAAPPRAAQKGVGAARSAYCLDESCPTESPGVTPSATGDAASPESATASGCECKDCNIWFNDIFLDTLLQSAVESHERIVAAGMCWRNSPDSADCRNVAIVNDFPVKQRQQNVGLSLCTKPWLWEQPMRSFKNFTSYSTIAIDDDVELVPKTWLNNSIITDKDKYAGLSIPQLPNEMISWSTVHAQCRDNDSPQWVHLLTIPLIAKCSQRLASLGMCNSTRELDEVVMVGSSWIAVSLSSYNINQCADPTRTPPSDVFYGSSLCNKVYTSANQTLECVDVRSAFQAYSYNCICPERTYFSPAAAEKGLLENLSQLSSYTGILVKSLVLDGSNHVKAVYNRSACLSCQRGCISCNDSTPCLRKDDLRLRTPLLLLTLLVMVGAVVVAAVLWKSWDTQIVVSSVGPYLFAILLSAMLAYLEAIVLFSELSDTICAIQPWPRHMGFILIFGFLFAKVWRVQVLARMPPGSISPGHLDKTIVLCISCLASVMLVVLIIWTAVAAPHVTIKTDANENSYELCTVTEWRYAIHGVEVLLLLLACLVAQRTRRLVLEWPEFKFITLPFLNAAIIKSLIAIFYFTLMPDKYADYLYLLQFFEMHFTITSLIAVLCGHKLYFIIRHKEDRDIGPTVPLNTLPGNAPGNSMGVGEQYMTESSTYGVINGSTCGADNRRESEAEIQSISDFPQQQLQIYHTQQTQDSSQTEVVPGKVSLRHVLLSCFSGSFADELDTPPSTAGNGASGSVPSGSNQGSSADDSPHPSLANDALMDGSTAGKDRDRAGSVQSGVHSTSETDAAINAKKRRSPAFVRLQGGIYGGVPVSKPAARSPLVPQHVPPEPVLARHETSL
eukprot:scpid5935/ scgid0378/ Probable G-protein coupled receptor CG31760